MSVRRWRIERAAKNGKVLHPRLLAIAQRFRQFPVILPEHFACRTVKRLDAGATFHKQDSVMYQWCDFVGADRQGQGPGDTEITDVGRSNFPKRAKSQILIAAPPHQPL